LPFREFLNRRARSQRGASRHPRRSLANLDRPACSRQEGQAGLSAVLSTVGPAKAEGPAKVECQHANASPFARRLRRDKPPQQVPGREVAGFQLAPMLPSQPGIHRRHHQGVEATKGRPLLRSQFWLSAAAEYGQIRRAFTRSPPPRGTAIFS